MSSTSDVQQDDSFDLHRSVSSKERQKVQPGADSDYPTTEGPLNKRNDEQTLDYDVEKITTQGSEGGHTSTDRSIPFADWDGPNDLDNPQTWSVWKKIYHATTIDMLAFAVTAGSSLITPSTDMIASDFEVSRTAAILPLTVYVLGLALGPMIAAPVSETFGRSSVYKASGFIYMLFIIGAGFSKSFASLLVCRLLAGVIGGPVLAVGAGSNADMFPPETRALAITCFIMMPFLGTALGPVIGGFAAQFKGWRWTQWCTIFISIAAYVLVLPIQETYKKAILSKRAKKAGVPGPANLPVGRWASTKHLFTMTLVRPLRMIFKEPIVLFLSLYSSYTFSVMFAFFAAYPYTFEKVYGFNTWQYGLAFTAILVGVMIGATTAMLTDRFIYHKKYLQLRKEGNHVVPPEHRLYNAMAGSFGVTIGLFWFAWTARPSIHWISPVLAGMPFAWGNFAIFNCATLYLVDVYGTVNGASAMAANGLARYTMSAVFPLFTYQMYETLTIPWATSLLAFVSLGMLPIPWVFFRYGAKIRAKSSYDTFRA